MSFFLVTLDGPAGVGKNTVGKLVAEHFGFQYIDTGKSYRAVGALTLLSGGDPIQIAKMLTAKDLERNDLYDSKVEKKASEIAPLPEVRLAVNEAFRCMIGSAKGTILDGRAGAYEFPEADVKFYLDASDEERARRCCRRAEEKGEQPNLREVLDALLQRDKKDRERATSPMKPSPDAFVIQTDRIDAMGVAELIITVIGHLLHGVRP